MLGVPEYLFYKQKTAYEMYGLAASDLFFKWYPGTFATMMRIHHPLPGVDPEISPTARFGGYPAAMATGGVVAADETTHRFVTLLSGPIEQRWHLDLDYSIGVP